MTNLKGIIIGHVNAEYPIPNKQILEISKIGNNPHPLPFDKQKHPANQLNVDLYVKWSINSQENPSNHQTHNHPPNDTAPALEPVGLYPSAPSTGPEG